MDSDQSSLSDQDSDQGSVEWESSPKIRPQPNAKLQDLPAEVLLEFFKLLDSREMVRSRRVWKEWLNVINSNKTLWRHFKIKLNKWTAWKDGSVLQLFDVKSQSTLIGFHAKVGSVDSDQRSEILGILLESTETLQNVYIQVYTDEDDAVEELSEAFHNFQAVDYRILYDGYDADPVVPIKKITRVKDDSIEAQGLQILWVMADEHVFLTHIGLFWIISNL